MDKTYNNYLNLNLDTKQLISIVYVSINLLYIQKQAHSSFGSWDSQIDRLYVYTAFLLGSTC